jgi:hypothetical protein
MEICQKDGSSRCKSTASSGSFRTKAKAMGDPLGWEARDTTSHRIQSKGENFFSPDSPLAG